jgi:Anaphase-promoting complex subunit 4 WD40 domain
MPAVMPSASTRPAPNTPVVLQDRVLSIGVRLVALCPRMDLVALVLEADTVVIQRLNWQRLMTLPAAPDYFGDVAAVAWAPDGSALAVASSTGRIRIAPIDAGSTSTAFGGEDMNENVVVLSYPVTALYWIETSREQPAAYDDRDMPTLDPAGMLAVGDANGAITLLSFNLALKIATVQLLPEGTAISHMSCSWTPVVLGYLSQLEPCALLRGACGNSSRGCGSGCYVCYPLEIIADITGVPRLVDARRHRRSDEVDC